MGYNISTIIRSYICIYTELKSYLFFKGTKLRIIVCAYRIYMLCILYRMRVSYVYVMYVYVMYVYRMLYILSYARIVYIYMLCAPDVACYIVAAVVAG